MIMRMAPEPSIDDRKRIHKELRDLLETTMVQQAQSSTKRWHPKAGLVHISSTCGAPKGYHVPSILWRGDDAVEQWQEPSLVRSRYIRNHDARPVQGARRLWQDLAGQDLSHYGDNDSDNHGRHPRI
jgi:hypothetical protein